MRAASLPERTNAGPGASLTRRPGAAGAGWDQEARYCCQASLMRATWPAVNWYMQESCV
jgi:hypothetical protein